MRKLSAVVLSMALVFNSMSMVSAGTEQDANDAYETSTQVENPWAELLGSGEDGTIENVTEENEQVLDNPWEDLFEDETTTEEPTTQEPTTQEPTTEEPTTQEVTTEEPTTEEPTQSQEFAIVTQPQNVTGSVGNAYQMSVVATGNGLKYQWQMSKDGGVTWSNSTVTGYNTDTISFTLTEAYHGRMYRCKVTNSSSQTLTSGAAIVYVDALATGVTIVTQPQSKTVAAGATSTISIYATGNGLKYQWQMSRDGGTTWANSTVDGYNSSKITFVPTEAYHGRQYRCVVTDNEGNSVESDAATILIESLKDSLVVVSQPQSVIASVNSQYVISVGATGNGLKYQWQMSRDGGVTWTNSSVDGYNTSKITFVPTEAYHGRQYRCVVTDQNGDTATSNGGTILIDTLKDELMVVAQPQNITASVGKETVLTVGATGNGLTYQWQMSSDGGTTWTDSSVDGYNSSKITFKPTTAYHGRQYRCVVTDQNGESVVSNGGQILIDTLAEELMIVTQPQVAKTEVSTKTVIAVGATGQGLKYQWQLSSDGGLTWKNSTVDGYNTTAITFNPTAAYHGRMYRCVVTDKNNNTVTSNGAAVVFNSRSNELTVISQPLSLETTVGGSNKISVLATGDGIKYQWQLSKDGGQTWSNSTVDGYNTSTIYFDATAAYDGRQYRCVITDKNGNSVESVGAVVTVK
ncbi:MAG: immunoglobulin domain-containing protein [Eubacterium sp.]|nr:immunoglobulin domain-containing protein [Eubacterium sp.]